MSSTERIAPVEFIKRYYRVAFNVLYRIFLAPIVAAGTAAYLKLGVLWESASFLGFLLFAAFVYTAWQLRYLNPLKKWSELTHDTDLIEYAKLNKASRYMPDKILVRRDLLGLSVMANGCSKWTRLVNDYEAQQGFKAIRNSGGHIRFLASCPVYLNQLGNTKNDTKAKIKAIKNASSLMKLRELIHRTRSDGGTFEIRTYKHLATLRLIILPGIECVVGHYQEDGLADSLDTPLLVFKCNEINQWGFGHAFVRLFDSEWHRAGEPTASEWDEIGALSRRKESEIH